MRSVLVFIDGTICDTGERHHLIGTPAFHQRQYILGDRVVEGSLNCLSELSKRYQIVYIGARPESARPATEEWLARMGFPKGEVYLGEEQADRLSLVGELKANHDFIAGIGDRWDDNELHNEIGCASIILEEFTGHWDVVAARIERLHRMQKTEENRIHLRGKVEGLARVCPLLLSKYGEGLWESYFTAVMEMAERTREARRVEDLASFAQYHFDPNDLSDAARWDAILREEDWEENPVYGLQAFELVEATRSRYVHKVTACYYAELWNDHGLPDIGYQIHCRTDMAWWNRPAWNPQVRFEQPHTLMQGDDCCLFIQYLPKVE